MTEMTIKVCPACRGCGMDVPTTNPCKVCGGTGHPRGYTPPTPSEVAKWIAAQI
jgi:RecJ-like exonuclease